MKYFSRYVFELKYPEEHGYKFLKCWACRDMDSFVSWQYGYQYKNYPSSTDWFPSKNIKSAKAWIKRNIM